MMRLIISMLCLMMASGVRSFVGVTWGRQQSQQLVPSMVADLLLQNRIPALRLMTSGSDISQAFAETNVSLHVTLGNQFFVKAFEDGLYNWLNERIKIPLNKGVKIVELACGSEPFSIGFIKEVNNFKVVEKMKMIRQQLDDMGLGHIKTTTAHGMDVVKPTKRPSQADFRDNIKGLMLESLEFFYKHGSPFVLYMFPIHFVREVMKFPIEFAFFDNNSTLRIQDGNVTYTNVVELMYDSVAWAITKAGYPNMKITIGQIGWPTDGYPDGSIQNAERFHRGLLRFLASNRGTPIRPGPIDSFLHSLSDENDFPLRFGAFQRHWGIYKADGNPKIKIDFTLQGRDDVYPTQAKGIVKMPKRWCIFNGDMSDLDKVREEYKNLCLELDCTKLDIGASCYGLNYQSKVSYAFNAHFQKEKQKEDKCDFGGLGQVVADNPSQGDCEFPVEILSFQDNAGRNGITLTV